MPPLSYTGNPFDGKKPEVRLLYTTSQLAAAHQPTKQQNKILNQKHFYL
jgi:hypothetical protein